ncbi:hypothetical protein FM104_13695 [Microbacterium esteraromaticum]|uniref:Uncharacterized protein n=1 Tax=Microbacterium esteraromaticum TaxID=57043 RepID=A0A1R4KLK5_9MICO|nr:hypothetical protein FM104_13695 [Microbacterium esteraromaticum]
MPLTSQPQPELSSAEQPPLLAPRGQDDRLPPLVRHLPRRRLPAPGVVVARWGDLATVLGEHGTDRLDTPPEPTIGAILVLVDEGDYRRCGRSSSAAKKAEAAFNISFARRNSAFSRFSFLISACASLVTPGRCPPSTLDPANPGADRFGRSDPQHARDRGDRRVLARILGPHLGDHTDSALTKLARVFAGTCHETDPSKEFCLRTHRGDSHFELAWFLFRPVSLSAGR